MLFFPIARKILSPPSAALMGDEALLSEFHRLPFFLFRLVFSAIRASAEDSYTVLRVPRRSLRRCRLGVTVKILSNCSPFPVSNRSHVFRSLRLPRKL